MTHRIHQEVPLNASPERVYKALTDATQFSAVCGGAPAVIDASPGAAFSCFGGKIEGRQIDLVPGKRIVQAGRAGNWGEGTYSIARFEFRPQGEQTLLVFDHTGFPEDAGAHLESGWKAMYWEPLAKYLG